MAPIRHLPLIAAVLWSLSAPAWAQDLRDLCPDRPGKGSPTCTVDSGHLQLEVGAVSVEHDRQPDTITDTVTAADLEVRLGVTDSSEIQASLSPFTTIRTLDRMTRARATVRGASDLTVGYRQSFTARKGLTFALQPFVVAPTGSRDIDDHDWRFGVVVPAALDLTPDIGLALTGEADWVPDADGAGHHGSYSAVLGLSRALGPVSLGTELAAVVDDDPQGALTQASLELFAGWIPTSRPNIQLDAGLGLGLNHATPDAAGYLGVTKRF